MVLVYHRLSSDPVYGVSVVPSMDVATFEAHLAALVRVADVVPLARLVDHDAGPRRRTARPQVAVTFDDDAASHVRLALPALARAGVPATFFLSGRRLAGLRGYWFEALEQALEAVGLPTVARLLDLTVDSVPALATACEAVPERLERLTPWTPDVTAGGLTAADLRTLVGAGHTVGFHTLHHPVLPTLDDHALTSALHDGRAALARATGQALRWLAYPHGRADGRVAAAAAAAGFAAAFVTGGRPLAPGAPRHQLGRWDPGPRPPEALVDGLTLRLHRAPAG